MSTSSYNSHDSITSGYGAGGVDKMIKFLTVPYPALIIHIMRKSSPKENEGDDDSFNQNSWEDYYQRPVIPNLEIDLTNFISYKRTNTNHHLNVNNSWSGSMSNSFLAASQNSERSLPDGNNDGGKFCFLFDVHKNYYLQNMSRQTVACPTFLVMMCALITCNSVHNDKLLLFLSYIIRD